MKLLYSLVTGLAFLAVTTETLSAIEQLPSENVGANLSAISKTLHISQWDHAYLKFQLEDVAGPVSTATLRLYYADSQAVTTKVWVASSDNWSASGSPPEEVGHAWSGGTLLGSVTNRSPGYLEIDVTPFIQQEAQGDGIASFEISNDASGWRRYSALNGSFAPMLRISTAGSLPPAPENQAPTARFTISPSTSTAPATLSFDASESSDLDGSIVGYAWDFGDGSNGNGISVSHHYSQAGDYTVMLEVSDNAGSTSQSSQTYRLGTDTGPTTPPPATGSNTLVPTQDVGASGKGQSETLNASRWDHGFLQFDLNAIPRPVNSATLRLFYLDTLPIDVTIKPTLGNDWSEASGGPAKNRSSDQNIQGSISNPGYIELDLSTLTNALQDADPRLSIELSNNSSGWRRFGSRESSTPPQLQLSYEGATPPSPNTPPPATNAPPVATIASDVSSAEAPATVTFDATQSSDSDGTIVAYQWDFGDETGSNEPVVTHQFSIARLYSITLTVTDDKGATHTASTSLSITAATPPPGSGGNGDSGTGDGQGNGAGGNDGNSGEPATASSYQPNADIGANKQGGSNTLHASRWDHAYLKFNALPLSSPVDQAIFRIYYQDSASIDLSLWEASSTNWDESSGAPTEIGNPGNGISPIATQTASGAGYVEFNVSHYVNTKIGQTESIAFELSNTSDGWRRFGSRESTQAPELRINGGGNSTPPDTGTPPAPSNNSPTASFSVSTVASPANSRQFDASASSDSDGNIAAYSWDFGDGTSGNGEQITHQYANSGQYTVTLTVLDNEGASSSTQKTFNVGSDLVSNLCTFDKNSPSLVENGNFQRQPSGPRNAGEDYGGWTSDHDFQGIDVLLHNDKVGLINGDMDFDLVKQDRFTGDPANGVAATPAFIFSDGGPGNPNGSTVWRQQVTGLVNGRQYLFYAYVSNALIRDWGNEPIASMQINGTEHLRFTVPYDIGNDTWHRIATTFTAGPQSMELEVHDLQTHTTDDLALTAIGVKPCL